MTGTKKDREALKNRYRKGMYPTENDFADVFESYVHKDDDIPMSKVVITDGDGNPTTLSGEIDKKADKTTLQTFIDETETILQVVRNDNNQIASTAIDNLLSRIQAAEDDIDTAEDNISGHETRIVTLESSKTDYEAFKERVRAFLEDADASDATINRWHEIETFLQGITDTETLTGLLNDLKNEILAAIPSPQSGNFIEYTTDLDAITDAPNGKIMQYWGQSNNKYKRGQFYERVEGKEIMIQTGTEGRSVHPSSIQTGFETFESRLVIFPTGVVLEGYATRNSTGEANLTEFVIGKVVAGNYAYMDEKCEITSPYEGAFYIHGHVGPFEWNVPIKIEVWISKSGKTIYKPTKMDGTSSPKDYYRQEVDGKYIESTVGDYVTIQAEQDIVYGESPSSWQHIHVDEVID
ncbi:MAG: hypothetical protein J6Y24_11385 [Bacteroidales bacterium]|nr:hypothetical protein [Bacteroidales bacterium]